MWLIQTSSWKAESRGRTPFCWANVLSIRENRQQVVSDKDRAYIHWSWPRRRESLCLTQSGQVSSHPVVAGERYWGPQVAAV